VSGVTETISQVRPTKLSRSHEYRRVPSPAISTGRIQKYKGKGVYFLEKLSPPSLKIIYSPQKNPQRGGG